MPLKRGNKCHRFRRLSVSCRTQWGILLYLLFCYPAFHYFESVLHLCFIRIRHMKGKITQTTLHVFDELCRHSEQQQSSSQEPHSFTCRMLNIPSTSQKCVNLSVWCLQSVILTHELYSRTSKAKTFFQLQNQSSGTGGKIYSPFHQSLFATQYRL